MDYNDALKTAVRWLADHDIADLVSMAQDIPVLAVVVVLGIVGIFWAIDRAERYL